MLHWPKFTKKTHGGPLSSDLVSATELPVALDPLLVTALATALCRVAASFAEICAALHSSGLDKLRSSPKLLNFAVIKK